MTVDSLVKDIEARMAGNTIKRRVKFDLEGDGAILVDGTATPPVVSRSDEEADVTLSLSAADLEQILNGSLDPQMAFMTGRLRVDGDMALAMQLAQVLS